MRCVKVNLGFSTADAESLRMEFDGSDLTVMCVDWQEKPVRTIFREVIAYRWGSDLGAEEIRDNETYRIEESPWLVREAQLAGVSPGSYVHYKLCFNSCGVVDVAFRKQDA